MKTSKIIVSILLVAGTVISTTSSLTSAASLTQINAGQKCGKLNRIVSDNFFYFQCVKKGKLKVWEVKGVVPTATTTLPPVTLSTQVANLAAFIDKYAQSIVTVSCNGSQGSGVSVSVSLTEAAKARGFQSYIITNEHVIYDCLVAGGSEEQVTITHKGIEYVGYLAAYPSWNDVNAGRQPDLASIWTTALVPATTLSNVKQPVLGHAVVSVGSAGGMPGVTTRGEIAGVSSKKIVTTAPAGRGSSGGALFNNLGQLLGFITAANASLVEVTPITELCSWVFDCSTNPIVYVP